MAELVARAAPGRPESIRTIAGGHSLLRSPPRQSNGAAMCFFQSPTPVGSGRWGRTTLCSAPTNGRGAHYLPGGGEAKRGDVTHVLLGGTQARKQRSPPAPGADSRCVPHRAGGADLPASHE